MHFYDFIVLPLFAVGVLPFGISSDSWIHATADRKGVIFAVTNENGRLIPGAEVTVGSGGEFVSFRGAVGVVGVPAEPLQSALSAVVSAPWFVSKVVTIAKTDSNMTVTLKRGRAIHGRVVDPDGNAVSGVRICGWAKRYGVRLAEIEDAMHGYPRFPFAVSDEAGDFVLRGIDEEETTVLAAGGSGWICLRGGRVSDRVNKVSLEVTRLFGASLRYSDAETGDSLVFGPLSSAGRSVEELDFGQNSQLEFQSNPDREGLVLAGVPARRIQSPPSEKEWGELFFATGNVPPGHEAKGRLRKRLPGYHESDARMFLAPVDGKVLELEIPMRRQCEEWGSLRIDWTGLSSIRVDARPRIPRMGLVLLNQEDPSASLAIEIWQIGVPLDLPKVPVGTFLLDCRVMVNTSKWVTLTPGVIEVDSLRGPAKITIDLSKAASATLSIEEDGRPFHGEILMEACDVADPFGPLWQPLSCYGPPYHFPILPVGDMKFTAFIRGSGHVETLIATRAGRHSEGTLTSVD